MTELHLKKIQEKFKRLKAVKGEISGISSKGDPIKLCDAYEIKEQGVSVKVFKKPSLLSSAIHFLGTALPPSEGAAKGMVTVEFEKEEEVSKTDMTKQIKIILEEMLEIHQAFKVPDKSAEKEYKIRRYCWKNKIKQETLSEKEKSEIESNLSREEVFPGYQTVVELDAYKKYREIAEYAVIHNIWGNTNLEKDSDKVVSLLKTAGLQSRLSRFLSGTEKKPIMETDMYSGGGDYVFTRIVTKSAKMKSYGGYTIVLNPDVLDRTDVFAYQSDKFGSTNPNLLERRSSMEEILIREKKRHMCSNELMFKNGISKEKYTGICCGSKKGREILLKKLKDNGINQINGIDIEKFVTVAERRNQWVEVANSN